MKASESKHISGVTLLVRVAGANSPSIPQVAHAKCQESLFTMLHVKYQPEYGTESYFLLKKTDMRNDDTLSNCLKGRKSRFF